MVAIESNIPDAKPCLDDGPIDRAKNLTHSLAGGASGDPCPAQASEETVEIPSVSSAHDTISTSRSSGKPSDDPTTSASRVVLSPASSSSSPSTSSSSSSCGSSKRASLNSSRGIASDTTHSASGDSANASSPGGSRRVSAESSSNNSSDFSSSGSGSPIASPDPVNKNARHGTSTNPKNRKRPKKQKEKPKKSTPSRDMPQIFPFASWMTDNFDAIGNRRLNEILLPGTHNSGTYTLMHTSDYAEDLPALQKCNPVWPVSLTIANFSRTQKRTISEQLHDGIRYLDIRICNYRNQFYLCHGMRAITLADLLGSIAIFAREHPREVVIVDFNHFYNMGEEKHLELQKKIAYAFHGILFPHSFLELTLQEAFAQGSGNIAVIYHKPFAKSYPFFPGDAIQSPWANTCSVRELKVRLLQSQQLFAPTAGPGLFVTQFIVTPPVPTILSGIMRPGAQHSLSGLARRLNKRVMLWIDEFLREGLAMNIAMIDHHHNCDFVKLIVDLNRQRAFKGTSTAASSAEPSAASAKPIAVGR